MEKRNIAEHHLVKNFEIKVLIAACYVSTRSSLHPIPIALQHWLPNNQHMKVKKETTIS
jgi:hypothetical protein